jgi:nucleotide-binding universal stress UspA family protein
MRAGIDNRGVTTTEMEDAMKTIVVGVDGSHGATDALKFAIEEARVRGAGLKAVAVWQMPTAVYGSGMMPVLVDSADQKQIAQDALDKRLEEVDAAAAGVSVTPVVREGQPAEVLVAEAHDADLLVVGTRGRGGFKGLLLGSVSQQCAHHATCPVAIVPNGDRPE